MNVIELRVGNWIHDNVESYPLTKYHLIDLLTDDNEHYANPIPLTDEWLIKFGVTDDKYIKGWSKIGDFYISKIKSGYELGSYDSEYDIGEHKTEVKYVHQLQNLYFCLTGEELTIKP
jgi:hypothetical protein